MSVKNRGVKIATKGISLSLTKELLAKMDDLTNIFPSFSETLRFIIYSSIFFSKEEKIINEIMNWQREQNWSFEEKWQKEEENRERNRNNHSTNGNDKVIKHMNISADLLMRLEDLAVRCNLTKSLVIEAIADYFFNNTIRERIRRKEKIGKFFNNQ